MNYNYYRKLNDLDYQLEVALQAVCEKLQLPQSKREKVERAYTTIADWIEKDGFFKDCKPYIFPYGSYAIGTTNKPLSREEFDLDFTVLIIYDRTKITTQQFLDELYNRLSENETYKGKLEKFRYCIRIQYADGFHLDIMPGSALENKYPKMKVPDTKKKRWVLRHPKGYVQWFEGLYIPTEQIKLFSYYKERGIVEIQLRSEPLPQSQPFPIVQPIQKATQLLKRYRDLYFKDNEELATRSVILTTIIGRFYNNETTIYDTLNNVINKVYKLSKEHNSENPIDIYNPADDNEEKSQRENFSDKWKEKPELYVAFLDFVKDVKHKWEELKRPMSKYRRSEAIKGLFGDTVGKEIYQENTWWSSFQNDSPFDVPPFHTIREGAEAIAKAEMAGTLLIRPRKSNRDEYLEGKSKGGSHGEK